MKMKKNLLFASVAFALATGVLTSCDMFNSDNPAPTPTPTKDERIKTVIPDDLREKIEAYVPIYDGVTPPNIEGTYYVWEEQVVASNLEYDAVGDKLSYPDHIRFYNQDMTNNTISMVRVMNTEWGKGDGAFISGYGDNFTVYFDLIVNSRGSVAKEAYIVSGTLTSVGISNIYKGFIMKEKDDPDDHLVDVGTFRFFSDSDGVSEKVDWPYAWPYNGPSAGARGEKYTFKTENMR